MDKKIQATVKIKRNSQKLLYQNTRCFFASLCAVCYNLLIRLANCNNNSL